MGQYIQMTIDPEITRSQFIRFMKEHNLKIKPWANASGAAEGAIHNYISGRTTSLTYITLEKLAAAAGCTVGEMLREPTTKEDSGKFVRIKHLEVHASAGGGFEVTSEPEGEPYYFKKTWLESKFGGHDGKLRVIHFDGDSMVPTIHSGDVGIVLTGITTEDFQSGKIYVLWDGRGLVVKRLEAIISDRPKIRVISDNSSVFSPYEIDAEYARIIGRVLWRSGNI